LTANTNGLTNKSGTPSYEWTRGGTVVGTGASYLLTSADAGYAITLTVTYSGNTGSKSASTGTVADFPALSGVVSISGTEAVGGILTVNINSLVYDATGARSYAWTRSGETETIGTGTGYTLVTADAGHTVTVTVTASRNSGSRSATSGVISATPVMSGAVVITGTVQAGQTLEANTDGLTYSGTLSYVWKSHLYNDNRDNGAFDTTLGSTAAACVLTGAEADKYISVTVTSTGNSGSVTAYTAAKVEATASDILSALLAAVTGDSAAFPLTVTVPAGTNISNEWGSINTAVSEAGKYVILDLSACTATGNTISTANPYSPGGNDMAVCASNDYLKGVILPSTLTSIGNNAFYGCSNLMSVGIPTSVTSIGAEAFRDCSSLTGSLDLSHVTTFVEEYGASDAFQGTAITSVTLDSPSGSLNRAFFNCASLTSVIFAAGSNITSAWDNYAFSPNSWQGKGDALWALYSAETRPLSSPVTFTWNGGAWVK